MPTPDELVPAARSHAADLQREILHDQQSKSVKLLRRQQRLGAGPVGLPRCSGEFLASSRANGPDGICREAEVASLAGHPFRKYQFWG
jgi:hypothetical protein